MNAIRSTSHLREIQSAPPQSFTSVWTSEHQTDAAPIELDDDDDSLDSISSCSTEAPAEHSNGKEDTVNVAPVSSSSNLGISGNGQPVENRKTLVAATFVADVKTQATIRFLSLFTDKDPLVELNEYYQSNGIIGVKSRFCEIACPYGKGPSFWRCDFVCPVTERTFSSDFPAFQHSDEIPKELGDMAHKVLGEYRIMDKHLQFLTKRGAKRSVALSVLHMAHPSVTTYPDSVRQPPLANHNGTHLAMAVPTKHRSLPKWVHELYSIGVTANTVKISYRQHPGVANHALFERTLLCCRIEIQTPIYAFAVGEPLPSKRLALDSAVRLLVKHVRRQVDKTWPKDSGSDYEKKEQLLFCDSKLTTFMAPIPTWATAPLPTGTKAYANLYLYRLEFSTKDGEPFLSNRTGLQHDCTSSIGIVFTKDPATSSSASRSFEAKFSMPGKGGNGNEEVIVRLKDRTVLDLTTITTFGTKTSVSLRISWMKHFNRTLQDWKMYGTGPVKQHRGGVARCSRLSQFLPFRTLKCNVDAADMDCRDEENSRSSSHIDRSYLFVPLQRSEVVATTSIDWDILRQVWEDRRMPYIASIDDRWTAPFIGKLDLHLVGLALAMVGLAILAPGIYVSLKEIGPRGNQLFQSNFAPWELALGMLTIVIGLLSLAAWRMMPPSTNHSLHLLENRFLVQKNAKNILYVLHRSTLSTGKTKLQSRLTTRSAFLTESGSSTLTSSKVDYNKRKFNLDLRTASFAEYYLKKYGTYIRYPGLPLLSAQTVNTHTDHDLLKQQQSCHHVHLIPELVHVLPVPRDFMYIIDHAKVFMTALEREVQLDHCAESLRNMTKEMQRNGRSSSTRVNVFNTTAMWESLLKEATTLMPSPTYQRLEFLGDAVLGFFLAINLMARNSSLKWDLRKLDNISANMARNAALYDGALRLGAGCLLQREYRCWRSAYRKSGRVLLEARSPNVAFCRNGSIKHSIDDEIDTVTVSDHSMSDVIESLLAAAFVNSKQDTNDSSGAQMIVTLLERLELSLPKQHNENERETPWFQAVEPCLTRGYPFEVDQPWQDRFDQIESALSLDHDIMSKLESNRTGLVGILCKIRLFDQLANFLEQRSSKILLWCALFDGDPSSDSDGGSLSSDVASEDDISASSMTDRDVEDPRDGVINSENVLYAVTMLRDILYHVGSYGLQLAITEELFMKNKQANEGDLHLLRACSMSDDVVVYIMFKAGMQELLYDQESNALRAFQTEMVVADCIGAKLWKERGGWILNGGIEEFTRRYNDSTRHCSSRHENGHVPLVPLYYGLAGGRLLGHATKLRKSTTSDLLFSMKAIAGALVLSIGVEGMWQCLGPLFDEVMLLSAAELRAEFQNTLVSAYR